MRLIAIPWAKIGCLMLLMSAIVGRTQQPLIFIIRVDDIMNRNTAILPRSIKPFADAVSARGAKVTWAVIPHRLVEKENQNGTLRQELLWALDQGHEISQHGYNHICPICGSTNHEMFCSSRNQSLAFAEQETLLVRGMQILRDSLQYKPSSFVPPGHSADHTTYDVLVEKGFTVLSGNATNKSFIRPQLFHLGAHNEFTWALTAATYESKRSQALQDIRRKAATEGYYCLLLHDHFIRQGYENGIVIRWIGEVLDSLNIHYGPRIHYLTLSQAALYFSNAATVVERPLSEEEEVKLSQNFPNPFNGQTTIQYELAFTDRVDLSLYNLKGEKIAGLFSGVQPAGRHRLSFALDGLPSGCYFYRLQWRDKVETRRLNFFR